MLFARDDGHRAISFSGGKRRAFTRRRTAGRGVSAVVGGTLRRRGARFGSHAFFADYVFIADRRFIAGQLVIAD